jgi:hypothetical protein
MKISATFRILLALVCLATRTVSADVVLSNFEQPNSMDTTIGNGVSSGLIGIEFFTDNSSAEWELNSSTLEFGGPAALHPSGSGPILYNVYLYNGSNNVPTTSIAFLGSFNFTNETVPILQATFTPSTTVSINPNSEYWMIVGAVTSDLTGVGEGTAGSREGAASDIWSFGSFGYFSGSIGGNLTSGAPLPGLNTPFLEIQATAEAVPEPSMLAPIGLVVFAVIILHRRKKSMA